MSAPPLLAVENLRKQYTRGLVKREVTFSLEADFRVPGPAVVGVMGPNGSGKTTLFELITGSNRPTLDMETAMQELARIAKRSADY